MRTRLERSLLEVEALVRDFADDNPHLVVSVLRFANVLGTDIITPISHNLRRRLLPSIAGFDPLVQFIEEDDVVRALEYVTGHQIPGVFNVAGAGKLPWSEVASIGGAFLLPLPPFRPRAFVAPLAPARDRCSSPRRWRAWCATDGASTPRGSWRAGFEYRYTSAGAVESFARANNLRRATGSGEPALPVRAGRGAVLPALAGRGAGHRRLGGSAASGAAGLDSGGQLRFSQAARSSGPRTAHSSEVMA